VSAEETRTVNPPRNGRAKGVASGVAGQLRKKIEAARGTPEDFAGCGITVAKAWQKGP